MGGRPTTTIVLLLAGLAAVGGVLSPPALGQCDTNYYWDDGYASWFAPDNWYHEVWDPELEECVDDDTIPGSGDHALVWSGNPYIATPGAACHWLHLDSQLSLLLGGSLSCTVEHVGCSSTGTFVQAGGTNSVSASIEVGVHPGSVGRFVQNGGSVSVSYNEWGDSLLLGLESGSNGQYELSNGELWLDGRASIGHVGTGTFIQMGGVIAMRVCTVGAQGSGIFAQSGGSVSASHNEWGDSLVLGQESGSNGQYELTNGELSLDGRASIGHIGTGTFVQTGGMIDVTGGEDSGVLLGREVGANGRYELSNVAQLQVDNVVLVGFLGTGSFIQSGGIHTILGDLGGGLYVGVHLSSEGEYELSGTAELYSKWVLVGWDGTGVFRQTDAINCVEKALALGREEHGDGRYELHGNAELSAEGEEVGYFGNGTFIQTGGTNTIGGEDSWGLLLGIEPGAEGTYDLSGDGSLSAVYETVGEGGTGTFIQTGGTNTVGEELTLGANSGSDGTYELNAGVLSVNGNVTIGHEGVGVLRQSNATLTVGGTAGGIGLGGLSGSDGRLELSGGALSVSSWMAIGQGGTGALIVSGPTASLDVPYLEVGHQAGTGTFDIQGSGASISARTLVLGAQSTFIAVPGASIRITTGGGSFENYSTDEVALGGLHNLNLVCDGDPRYLEVSGYDDGANSPYCWYDQIPNFQIGLLTVNGVLHLVDNVDNGNRGGPHGWDEALYVDDLTTETGGIIYTHGLHIYIGCDDPFAYPWVCPGNGCGDFDQDCDADSVDFAEFALCLSGPDVPIGAECNAGDCDADGDVDLTDFAAFQVAFTGP